MGIYSKKLKEEVINESSVYRGNNINITLDPDLSRNYGNDIAYFKVYDSESITSKSKIARISITAPKYIIHNKNVKNEQWKLNHKERKMLQEILKSKCTNGRYSNQCTVWEAIVKEFEYQTGEKLDISKGMPDYNSLE